MIINITNIHNVTYHISNTYTCNYINIHNFVTKFTILIGYTIANPGGGSHGAPPP